MANSLPAEITRTFSLLEIMQSVTSVINRNYEGKSFWVRCELVKMSLHQASGHCYLELVDKNENSIVAQMKGIIWADHFRNIQAKFKNTASTELISGMKVLFLCSVSFHAVHGMSLFVTDIEPSFTLGEMARTKNESIRRLKDEKLFTLNKTKSISILPKRIAVISVATSRGYHDFISTIVHYHKHFALELTLFEATLQGENAVPTIVSAMRKIAATYTQYDAMTIIRGGAGDTGLSCYDEYLLAREVAAFPLPVITGIGHATNETVTEMVAWKNCITPTAAADFFLSRFYEQDQLVGDIADELKRLAEEVLSDSKEELQSGIERFQSTCRTLMERDKDQLKNVSHLLSAFSLRSIADEKKNLSRSTDAILNVPGRNIQRLHWQQLLQMTTQLDLLSKQLASRNEHQLQRFSTSLAGASQLIIQKKQELKHFEEKVGLLDPANTLRRGYSITRMNGKAMTDASKIKAGAQIETILADGSIISTVEKTNPNHE